MFNLLVRVRCTSVPEIRVMCLLTLAFLFCVNTLPFFAVSRARSSEIFIFSQNALSSNGYGFRVNLNWWCCSNSSHLLRFFPFFHTPVSPILIHVVFSGVFQLREGWWLHPSDCSFGENTDAGHHFSSLHLKINQRMQIHQKGICIILWGESFCLNNQSFENQDFGKYVFICIVCHGRAGDSISRVPCTCSY